MHSLASGDRVYLVLISQYLIRGETAQKLQPEAKAGPFTCLSRGAVSSTGLALATWSSVVTMKE